jgi:hypothetical protein
MLQPDGGAGPVWGPKQQEITAVLAREPTDIASALQQMDDLQALLEQIPPTHRNNPVADFNRLYRTITAKILQRHDGHGFSDPTFLALLDVEFAKRYFNALRMWGDDQRQTPEAWAVLFCRLTDRRVRPLPAAAAGVNAHINYDLPFALIATWEQVGHEPAGSGQHKDYLIINEIFFECIPELRRGYLKRWQRYVDYLNGKLDDWYQDFLVEFTRNLAWQHAEKIWPLRNDPQAHRQACDSLDQATALLGKALLSPFAQWMQ